GRAMMILRGVVLWPTVMPPPVVVWHLSTADEPQGGCAPVVSPGGEVMQVLLLQSPKRARRPRWAALTHPLRRAFVGVLLTEYFCEVTAGPQRTTGRPSRSLPPIAHNTAVAIGSCQR